MSLSYQQLKPILYRIAPRFANYKYEINELVNAVWLMGNVQKLENIKFAAHRIRYDIIDYIRSQEGRKGRPKLSVCSLNARLPNSTDDGKPNTLERYLGRDDPSLFTVDFDDNVDRLVRQSCNNRQERLVLKLKLAGFTLREIGKIVGITESSICYIMQRIRKNVA